MFRPESVRPLFIISCWITNVKIAIFWEICSVLMAKKLSACLPAAANGCMFEMFWHCETGLQAEKANKTYSIGRNRSSWLKYRTGIPQAALLEGDPSQKFEADGEATLTDYGGGGSSGGGVTFGCIEDFTAEFPACSTTFHN